MSKKHALYHYNHRKCLLNQLLWMVEGCWVVGVIAHSVEITKFTKFHFYDKNFRESNVFTNKLLKKSSFHEIFSR